MTIKIGHSTDIHQLVEGRKLYLGGIEIPFSKGALGHSDADVLLHAVTESIIGAMGSGDIGTFFPDTDPEYKDIRSSDLLEEIVGIMKEKGFRIGNVDATIYTEAPKVNPYVQSIRENIASILDVSPENINVKATRGEKLGFIGRGEGIAAESVCLLFQEK